MVSAVSFSRRGLLGAAGFCFCWRLLVGGGLATFESCLQHRFVCRSTTRASFRRGGYDKWPVLGLVDTLDSQSVLAVAYTGSFFGLLVPCHRVAFTLASLC